MYRSNTTTFIVAQRSAPLVLALLSIATGGCDARKIAKEEINKAITKQTDIANKKLEEVRKQVAHIEDETSQMHKWADRAKLLFAILGATTLLVLVARPVGRVAAVVLLRRCAPKPRLIKVRDRRKS